MSALSERRTVLHHLPFSRTFELLHVEELVLGYQNSWSLDLGALCYLRRSSEKRKPRVGRTVDSASYCKIRASQIRSFARAASDFYSASGLRISTIFNLHSSFVRFLDWCDRKDHTNALATRAEAHIAFTNYCSGLNELVAQNELHINTAAAYQKNLVVVMATHFGFENLGQGIRLLAKSSHLELSTLVPHEQAQAQVLAWCMCLFSGLSELVLENKAFPFSLLVPNYLNWPENRIWVFPLRRWCETPKNLNGSQKYKAYDFQNGCVRTSEEIDFLFGTAKFPSTKLAASARERISAANGNQRDYARLDRAVLAMQAFFLMFIATTGMNLTQAAELPWNEELNNAAHDPLVERQGFRTIKYRANNRKVSFELGIQYMPAFKRYLDLRKYFLNGQLSEFLFHGGIFPTGESKSGTAGCGKEQVQTFFKTLHRLCPDLPKVLPKQWRAAKQDYVIRNYDPTTAATAMQHSKATALKHYSNGSDAAHQAELSSYFNTIEHVVTRHDLSIGETERRSIGACSAPNNPRPISESPPIVPDCIGPEGCLFCEKYRIHVDRRDIKKLLSSRYCLRKTGAIAENTEQYERIFGAALQRIEEILAELRTHNKDLVDEIVNEVDINGDLDHYWEAKLELLAELEIL